MRNIATKTNILKQKVVTIVNGTYGIFAWLGTKETLALSFALRELEIENQIYYRAGMPIFIEVKTKMSRQELEEILQEIKIKNINKTEFQIPDMLSKAGKYNYIIPKDLLKKQFIEDCIDVESMKDNL